MKQAILFFFATIFFLISCTRTVDNPNATPDPPKPPPTTEATKNLVADSVFLYSKEIYFWNTLLPDFASFNPRQYVGNDELTTAQNVIAAIRKATDATKKFSYATTYEQAGLVKSDIVNEYDYGFFVKQGLTNLRTHAGWFVNYVYAGSQAGIAGVQRGWKINKINGTTLAATPATVDILNAVFVNQTKKSDSTTVFEFIKPDGTTQTNTFTIDKFYANPVLHSTVITTANNRKVGYLVFNRFFGQSARTELGKAFADFQNKGVNELIVDLRYNRGGLTATQDTMANLMAPLAANGSTIYSYEYNTQLQADNFPLLKQKFRWPNGFFKEQNNKEVFEKKGSLNLTRVFFIVSEATASSSELLINNLKPVMDVQIIGDDNTFGKSYGFFGVDLFQKVTFYPVSFRTKNQQGTSVDDAGFKPIVLMYDGVDKNWGDQTEDCLAAALYYINNGNYPLARTLPRSVANSILKLAIPENKTGMFLEIH